MIASTAHVVGVLAVALALIGIVLFVLALRLVRETRADHIALGPLEVLGDRSWRRHDVGRRAHDLDKARPAGAEPSGSGAVAPAAPVAEIMPALPIAVLASNGPADGADEEFDHVSDRVSEEDQTHDIAAAENTTSDDAESVDEAAALDGGSEWAAPGGALSLGPVYPQPPPPPQPGPLEPSPAPPLPDPLPEPEPLPAPLPDPTPPEPIPLPGPAPDPLPEPQPYPAPEPGPEPQPIPEPGPGPIPAIPAVPFEGAVRIELPPDEGSADGD